MAELIKYPYWLMYEQVATKKTGLPSVGHVYGMIKGDLYEVINYRANHASWDKLYPDWREKPVYYVVFEKPQKICSLQEAIEQSPELTEEECKERYESVFETNIITYPHDDLEPFNQLI